MTSPTNPSALDRAFARFCETGDPAALGEMSRLRDCMEGAGLWVGRYIVVVEFQGKSGDGWPHWHLLVEVPKSVVPKAMLQEAWKVWRGLFRVGGLQWNPGDVRSMRVRQGARESAAPVCLDGWGRRPTDSLRIAFCATSS